MTGIKHNGITVSVQKWSDLKKPILAVQFDDRNEIHKVASFNSAESADWFIDVMEEFFKGIVKEA